MHFAGTKGACSSATLANPAISNGLVTAPDGTRRVPQRGPKSNQDPRMRVWCIPDGEPDGEQVLGMIAIVPDPVQTHMSLWFDRTVEAIQLAAASKNYVIDRYWLPWDLEPKKDWSNYESFKEATNEQKQKESQPGLLIFRWGGKSKEGKTPLVYVFLAGDTPTSGVNGAQFENAVKHVSLINQKAEKSNRKAEKSNQKGSIRIMGPTFSGSLKSLRRLVDAQASSDFTIFSGTVSNLEAIQDWNFSSPAPFRSFVRPTQEAVYYFKEKLIHDNEINCPQSGSQDNQDNNEVAILSEAVTIGDKPLGRDKLLGRDKPLGRDKLLDESCIDTYEYSREISSLRNAYPASIVQNAVRGNDAAAEHPFLSLNLTEQSNSSDEPPDFAKVQSPLSKEAVLMNFAAEMRRKRYKYIGIIGTNPLDTVFLIKFLRNEVPDARIFQMGSDVLLEHEPEYTSYIGTLAVTTYPLLNSRLNPTIDQTRMSRRIPRLPFQTQFEEGQYNAAVCILRTMLSNAGYDSDLGRLSERKDCPNEPAPSEPALWLTAIGAGGHWPIEVIDETKGMRTPPLGELPPSWKTLSALLCSLAFLHILVLLGLAPFSPKFRDFTLGTVAPTQQLFAIHFASATLACALALVGLSAGEWNGWTAATSVFVAALLIVCLLPTYKYFHWWTTDKTRESNGLRLLSPLPAGKIAFQIIPSVFPWAASAWLAYLWWRLLYERYGDYGAFFSYRAVHLTSIVSPLTPMLPLLAVIYLAAIFYAWHLRFNDKVRPRLNPSDKGTEGDSGKGKLRPGWRSEKFIVDAINNDRRNALWAGCMFVIWALVFDPFRFAPFESPWFQKVYGWLFCIVILLILASGFRLALVWRKLRRFLLELNRQRVRIVFSRLKGEDWPSIWFYGSEDADWDYMVRSEEIILQLKNGGDSSTATWPDGDTAIKNIRRERRKLQEESFDMRVLHTFTRSRHDGQIEKYFCRAQDYLATILNRALDALQEIWHKQPPWVEEEDEEPASTNGVVVHCCKEEVDTATGWQRQLEKYVALRYVAFIRGVIARIRLLVIFLPVSFSLALISLSIYSFEPHRELIWSVTALFVGIGCIMLTVLMQMHRDPILSRITGTKPNELGLTFYVRIAALGIGPLLTLLATHYPSISRYVVSFLQPGLEALK